MNTELKTPRQDIRGANVNLLIALINLRNKTVDRYMGVTSLMGYLKEKKVFFYTQDIAEVLIEKGYVVSEGKMRRRNIQWKSKVELTTDFALEIIESAQQHRKEKLKAHKRNKALKEASTPDKKLKKKRSPKTKPEVKAHVDSILDEQLPIAAESTPGASCPTFLDLLIIEKNSVKEEHEKANEEISRLQNRLDILTDRMSSLDMLLETYNQEIL